MPSGEIECGALCPFAPEEKDGASLRTPRLVSIEGVFL